MQKNLMSVLGEIISTNLLADAGKPQGVIVSRAVQIEKKNFDYQIYLPSNIKTTGSLPVIVFLHGIRERGIGGLVPTEGTLSLILKQLLKRVPAIILLPQCRPANYWSDSPMEQMVVQAIQQTVGEFNADPNRLYLSGASMGGYGVWHFALKYPGKFAALVSICGGSPILTGDRFSPIAQKVGKTPAWLFHGAEDKVVPVSESRELVKALEVNQGDVKYSEYAGVGHNVWFNALAEKKLMPWLLSQKLG